MPERNSEPDYRHLIEDLIYGVPFQDLISWEATVLDGKGNIDFSRLR